MPCACRVFTCGFRMPTVLPLHEDRTNGLQHFGASAGLLHCRTKRNSLQEQIPSGCHTEHSHAVKPHLQCTPGRRLPFTVHIELVVTIFGDLIHKALSHHVALCRDTIPMRVNMHGG